MWNCRWISYTYFVSRNGRYLPPIVLPVSSSCLKCASPGVSSVARGGCLLLLPTQLPTYFAARERENIELKVKVRRTFCRRQRPLTPRAAVWVRVFLRSAAAEMSRHVVSVTNPNFCSLSSETEVNWGSSQYCTDNVGFAPSATRFHLVFNGIK